MPKQLKTEMPTIEELEQELGRDIETLLYPIDEKKNKAKGFLAAVKGEKLKRK